MIVLALDPGLGRCGYALLTKKNQELVPLDYGCIETSAKTPLSKRLEIVYTKLQDLIDKYQPQVMVLEQLFFNSNQKTAIMVGQAQGVMLLCAGRNNLEVIFLTPLQVKMAITGYGVADKEAVKKMIIMSIKLKNIPKLDDTIDALAVGMSYLYNSKFK